MRIEQAERQAVYAFMVMKRDKHHVARYALRALHHHHGITAARGQACIAAMPDAEPGGCIRIHLHVGRRAELVAIADLAGTGAGMKVFHHATGIQPERVFLIGPFVVIDKRQGDQLGLAAGVLKYSVRVEALRTFGCRVLVAGPLDAATGLDLVVTHAGIIQQAALRQRFQFVEYTLGGFREIDLAALFKTTGNLVEDP